jgi:hypothetical protein
MTTPFNARTLAPVRLLLAYKRALVDARKYVDGADSLDLEERLLATIDALAERLAAAEELARVNPKVPTEYERLRLRQAAAWQHVEPMAATLMHRRDEGLVDRDDVTTREMTWALAADAVTAARSLRTGDVDELAARREREAAAWRRVREVWASNAPVGAVADTIRLALEDLADSEAA